jgi:multicomponent Na+:H+ antiporter subunit E
VFEILKANLHVTRLILDPRLPIQPQLVRGTATQKTELGQVIYANSITLTPGTITLDLRNQSVLVHAISDHTACGISDGVMDKKITTMEGSA